MVQSGSRRNRFVRVPLARRTALGTLHEALLALVAQATVISLPQLAAALEITEKRARRHMRKMFDLALVSIVPVTRAALADVDGVDDASLLFGSAPAVYILTKAGARALAHLRHEEGTVRPVYGPKSSPFIAHELMVTDVLLWLLGLCRNDGVELTCWKRGGEAMIDLGRATAPQTTRPDAWFALSIGERVLVGLVEADRGTERGPVRWTQKLGSYKALFMSGRLKDVTGYAHARVLVVVPSDTRRDQLAGLIANHAEPPLAARFWITTRQGLIATDLSAPVWRRPGQEALVPLLEGTF